MDEQSAVAFSPTRPTLEALHAAMAAKRAEYDQLRERHAELWQRRHAGTLEREGYIDFLWSEDRMAVLLREIEQLTPAVLYAEAEAAIVAGKQHYDAHSEAVTAAATQICEAWATFTHAWATRQGEVTPQPHAIPGAAPQTKSEAATDRPPSS